MADERRLRTEVALLLVDVSQEQVFMDSSEEKPAFLSSEYFFLCSIVAAVVSGQSLGT